MGLIDLRTDLKNLKYGKDRIGGGSSNQPFVQKPIPDSFSAVGNTGGLDVLTRGGSLVFQRTADDVSRLTKLLLTGNTFQGPFFTIKQNVLSRQGVQTQASPKGLNEGAYLPTSTLAQVAVSATGLHFNKQGLNPIPGLPGSLTTYSDVVTSTQDADSNRLVKFTDNFVNKKSGNTLYSYPGGPGSILGLGKTSIQTPVDQRTGINTAGDKLLNFFGTSGIKNPDYELYELMVPPDITIPATKPPPEYTIEPIPALKYKAFTNPRPVNLDYRRYISLSYNAGVADQGSEQVRNNLTYGQNNLITLKTAPAGTQTAGIDRESNSKYAINSGLTTPGDFELFIPNTSPDGLYEGNKPSVREKAMGTTPFTGDSSSTKPTGEARNQGEVLPNLEHYTYTQQQLKDAPSYRVDSRTTDFRKTLKDSLKGQALKQGKLSGALTEAPDYTTENIEERVHLGNPGDPLRNLSDYTKGTGLGPLDTLNAITLYQSANVRQDNQAPVNDLVKFRIAVIEPDGKGQKTFIHFRAFLDTITDNYSADWSSHRYVGRGENFWTYQGFDRTISLGWTVYAQSKEELIPMYKRLNYLASSLAPDYNNGFMRGLLCQLTIGGYVYEQPGFIRSLTYELSDQSTWEIGINDKGFTDPVNRGDDRVKELPHMIKVTGFNFTPIHTFIPQVQKNNYRANKNVASFGEQRYIALANGTGSAANNYDS
jgi:hypothetical protein